MDLAGISQKQHLELKTFVQNELTIFNPVLHHFTNQQVRRVGKKTDIKLTLAYTRVAKVNESYSDTGQSRWVAIPVIQLDNIKPNTDFPPSLQNYFEGRDVFHEHVKEYKLAFSNDGSNFQVYQESGMEKVRLLALRVPHRVPLTLHTNISTRSS